eukprot:g6582.t1
MYPSPMYTLKFQPRLVHNLPKTKQANLRLLSFRPCASRQLAQSSNMVQIPKSIRDIDNGRILGFGADLSEDHPGYFDLAYKQRRKMIADLAKEHEIGTPIPYIEYTSEEKSTWREVYLHLKELYPLYACKEFNKCFENFKFSENDVPQLEDISQFIKNKTGWQIRPVAGLMHPRDFLNGLAFKTFHSTQYFRHHSNPTYTPEPDLVHEILGHVALLADPDYCHLMQKIGKASLGASEKELWHLTKVYWYTIEFGVVFEEDEVKAFGAGILSSFGELQWMAENRAKIEPFNPYVAQPKMSYKDGFQKRYFALQSFKAGSKLLNDYALMKGKNRQ